MGVPQFAPWLIRKYPALVQSECPTDVHGLYIDLNGLIHPCCHDDENAAIAQRSEDEKLRQICFAIEELVVTTSPRHILFIAIDGVAPRAKMNQQRARRYMSAAVQCEAVSHTTNNDVSEFTAEQTREVQSELNAVEQDLLQDPLYGAAATTVTEFTTNTEAAAPDYWFMDDGPGCPYEASTDIATAREAERTLRKQIAGQHDAEGENVFDSNCISPGTTFMERVSAAVYHYVVRKLATHDAIWSPLQVIFSDAHTPGEGEHKLIDFIRTQAARPGFCGRGAHIIAGLDADLIFLGLALHVPNVFLLRDQRRSATYAPEKRIKHTGNAVAASSNSTPTDSTPVVADIIDGTRDGNEVDGDALFMNDNEEEDEEEVDDVRVYIARNTSCEYFSIDIIAHSLVSEVYQLCVAKDFHMRVDPRCAAEGLIAANGYDFAAPSAHARQRQKRKDRTQNETTLPLFHPCTSSCNSKIIDDFIVMAMLMGNDFLPRIPSAICGEAAMDNLLEVYVSDVLPYGYLTAGGDSISAPQLQRLFAAYARVEAAKFRQRAIAQQRLTAHAAAQPLRSSVDDVWRSLYYRTTSISVESKREACRAYVEGLCFVWRYYATVTSAALDWSWYYPFHHAPLALDIADYLQEEVELKSKTNTMLRLTARIPTTLNSTDDAPCAAPPDALTQLLCILPPTSAALVPLALQTVMRSPPEELQASFPRTWLVDFTAAFDKDYLATVLLPFADLPALRAIVRDKLRSGELSAEDRARMRCVAFHTVLQLTERSEAEPEMTTSEERMESDTVEREDCSPATIATNMSPSSHESPRDKRATCNTSHATHTTYGLPADMLQPYPSVNSNNNSQESSGFRALTVEEQGEGITRYALYLTSSSSSSSLLQGTQLTTPLRPRSYSHTVVIPNLTRGSDGRLVALDETKWPRRRRAGRCNNNNKTSARSAIATATTEGEEEEGESKGQVTSPLSPDEGAKQDVTQNTISTADRFPWFGELFVCVCALSIALVCLYSVTTTSTTLRDRCTSVLRVCAVCVIAGGLTMALGLVAPDSVLTAHTIRRHHTRFTYVDWQCDRCLSLNFGNNLRCFICGAPYDVRRCNALFSRKAVGGGVAKGGVGVGLEYDHTPHLEHYCLRD